MTIQSHIAKLIDIIADDYQRLACIYRLHGDEQEAQFYEHKAAVERERAQKKREEA